MNLPKIIAFSRTKGAPVCDTLQKRCIERIVQCHALLTTTMPAPTLSFDLRGTTAGQAFPTEHHIRLNGQLLNENTEHFIEQTLGHEWAHLAAQHLYGNKIRPHGNEWKQVMRNLGLDPARCHTYTTQRARKARPGASKKTTRKPIFIPTGEPVSLVMWTYAQNLAQKKRLQLPVALKSNKQMMIKWLDLAAAYICRS